MANSVDIQTTVKMYKWLAEEQDHSCLTRMFIAIDPITKLRECTVYTDDGKGNGDYLFSFPMD